MNRHQQIWISAYICCLLAIAGCSSSKQLDPYPYFIDLVGAGISSFPPVILVGRIISSVKVGSPRLSRWDRDQLYQQYCTRVAVEKVVNGDVQSKTAEIFFLKNIRSQGLTQLGTRDQGGVWELGDRELFFLQYDSGQLRIICDTYSHCVIPVFNDSTQNVRTERNVADTATSILFARGKQTTDAQMIKSLENAVWFGLRFAPSFSLTRLEQIIQSEPPAVRQAACESLPMFNQSDSAKTMSGSYNAEFDRARIACKVSSDSPRGEK